MKLTANRDVLRLGDEEVSDAAGCKERPQRPENLCEKNEKRVSIKDAIGQVTTSAINITETFALTGVDHLRRPKNAMGVL